MNKYSKTHRPVNLLPLMDVIFLVLAVFFYLMLFMVRHEGIKVDLPSAATAQQNNQLFKSVSIDKNNKLYLDKKAINWEHLQAKITELKSEHGEDLIVYIAADNKAEYKYFIRVLDALKSNGINNVNIETIGSK